MQYAKAGRGLLAACIGLWMGGLASAEGTVADTHPVPRPIEVAAVSTATPPLPTVQPAPDNETDAAAPVADAGRVGPVTGFPIPRYVSLKATEANIRRGPSRSHRIDWVFQRRGMPMMIVAEYGHWRRVVDRDGVGGWVHYAMLSGARTAIVEVDLLPLYQRPDTGAPVRANAELGVVGHLLECRPGWCEMEVGGYRGWVETSAIWGVDPGETFD